MPAQDIGHAAFVLGTTCTYFPPDTVHVAVVDPGVGTSRRALLVVTPGGKFVVPDNGLLTYVVELHLRALAKTGATLRTGVGFMEPFTATLPSGWSVWDLTESTYWRSTVSDTFHGRDVFSPVAAHLSLGVNPDSLGRRVENLMCVRVFENETHDAGLYGRVVFVDRFGNLVTNVRPSQLPGGDVEVDVGGAIHSRSVPVLRRWKRAARPGWQPWLLRDRRKERQRGDAPVRSRWNAGHGKGRGRPATRSLCQSLSSMSTFL